MKNNLTTFDMEQINPSPKNEKKDSMFKKQKLLRKIILI